MSSNTQPAKDFEGDLRLSLQLLRTVTDDAVDAISLKDANGRYRLCNPAAASFLGSAVEEILGRDDAVLFDTATADRRRGQELRVMATGKPEVEHVSIFRGAAKLTFEAKKTPWRSADGTIIGTMEIVRDITAHVDKRVEQQLRESENQLAIAQQIAKLGSWEWQPSAGKVSWSKGLYAVFGVAPGTVEPSFDVFLSLLHPDDRPVAVARMEAMLAGADQFANEFRLIRPDGTMIWIHSQAQAIRDSAGTILAVHGTDQDITSSKQSAEALRDSEFRFRILADAIPQIVWIAGPDGGLSHLNAKATEYTGIGIDQLTGWSWDRVIHPEDLAATVALWSTILQDGTPRDVEFRIRRSDGVYRWHITRQVPVRNADGEILSWYGTCTDIEDLKNAERALRESELWFRSVLDNYPAAVFLKDLDGRYLFVNRHATEEIQIPQPEWIGKTARDLFSAEVAAQFERNDLVVAETLQPHQTEGTATLPDGSQVWYWTTRFPLFQTDHELYAICAISIDITQRKKSEETIRKLNGFLETVIFTAAEGICVCHPMPEFPFVEFSVWNEQMTDLTGYTMEEINRLGWYESMYPELELRRRAQLRMEQMRAGQDLRAEEWEITRRDGQRRIVAISTSRLQIDGNDSSVAAMIQDVTHRHYVEAERQRAIRELQRSEERFSKLFASSPFSIIVATYPDGKIVEVNEAFLQLFDFEREDVLGQTTLDINIWVDLQDRATMVERLREAESARDMEIVFRTKRGALRTLVMSVEIIQLEGKPHSLAMSIDITERKRIEAEWRKTAELLRAVAEGTTDAVFAKDLDGKYLFFNSAACQFVGKQLEDVLRNDDRNLFDLDSAQWLMDYDRQVMASGRVKTGEEILTAAGVTRIFLSTKGPYVDEVGNVIGLVGVAREITESKRTVHELQHSVSRLQATLESTADGILVVDLDGRMIDFNQQFITLWNFPPDLIAEARKEDLVAAFNEYQPFADILSKLKDPPAFVHRVQEIYAKPEAQSFDVLEFQDGRVLERESRPQWLDGKPVGRVFSFRDVTERKRLEEQLLQSQKMDAIGQLAGGVAHDFNNLLTVINGYAAVLLGKVPAENPWRESIVEIHEAGERAAELTRQLLTFSRKAMTERKLLNLNEIVRSSHRLLQRLIGERVQLAVTLDEEIGGIWADRNQIDQVLMNLAINAADAMPQGGQLTLQTRHIPPGEAALEKFPNRPRAGCVQLVISDSGLGMSETVRSRIFEPFFTTKGIGQGTGLGLAVVHGVIQQSDGVIDVHSVVGQGTTFTIWFPVLEAVMDDLEDLELASSTHLPLGTETVLLVEDEAPVRRMEKIMLEALGYTVLEADNGAEAISYAERRSVPMHLLVTDVMMPDVNGAELAAEILARRPDICVLFVSGYADDAVLSHGADHDSRGFLQKPFTPAVLACRVRELLDQAARRHL